MLRRRFYNTSNNKIDTSKDYFNIKSLSDNNSISFTNNVYYSINDGNWNTLLSGQSIIINTDDRIYFKAELVPTSSNGIGTFTISNTCNLSGNIMSLIFGDDFENHVDLTGKNYAFSYLFENCITIENAQELMLPATTLSTYCYRAMFSGCTALKKAPSLPSETLTTYCYSYMFQNCKSLEKAPLLPATTLATYCYRYMFYGCESLKTAPELPATTLAGYCYQYMFYGCSSLTKAPKLPAKTVNSYCYHSMFYNCIQLTEAPELPAIALPSYCYAYMFHGCTSLITAPELPARSLGNYCYYYMFRNCSQLTQMPELPATILKAYCYAYMFNGCYNIKQSCVLPAVTLANYCYQYMFYGCTQLMQIIALAGNMKATNCLLNWTGTISKNGYFLKNPDVNSNIWSIGSGGIPEGWYINDYPEQSNSIDYSKEYFTIEGLTQGSVTLNKPDSDSLSMLQYSLNGNEWISFINQDSVVININKGDKVRIKAITNKYSLDYESASDNKTAIQCTCYVNIYGNIMSLIYGDSFEGITKLDVNTNHDRIFAHLLFSNSYVISAKNLIIPIEKIPYQACEYMFRGCSNLIEAPELPATKLSSECYSYMFSNCTSLKRGPKLPALTLDTYCYYRMFENCTSLIVSPELCARKLITCCYNGMFYGCNNLNKITMLATDVSASNCLTSWVSEVASSGTFYKHPDVVLTEGVNGIPSTWDVVNKEINIISFKINFSGSTYHGTYQTEENTTWEYWINSSYNTKGFIIWSGYITTPNYEIVTTSNVDSVTPSDKIMNNHTYILI